MSGIPNFLKGYIRLLLFWALCIIVLCLISNELWGQSRFKIMWMYSSDHESLINKKTTARQKGDFPDHHLWEQEYARRVGRVREVCRSDDLAKMIPSSRAAILNSDETNYLNNIFPFIQFEENVLFCFIPKVASTNLKQFFLNVSNIPVDETLPQNSNAFHVYANEKLKQISLMHYPATTMSRFFKIIFVRHPFDRLVSAFRNKAEGSRSEFHFFYEKYWDRIVAKLHGDGTVNKTSKVTFQEFVWYLVNTPVRDYDVHWAPYWSRCDPCLVDYDFIGKVETGDHDFPYAFRKLGINSLDWRTKGNPGSRNQTLMYFAQVKDEDILKLYKIYQLDFEMFDYSVDEFLSKNTTLRN